MMYYLCQLFDGTEVDGMYFEKSEGFEDLPISSKQPKFNDWKKRWLNIYNVDSMIDEYIRLTNIAFKSSCSTPPVFLFDEVQTICYTTDEKSSHNEKIHTGLSLVLTALGSKRPICICTGTNDGNLRSLTEPRYLRKKITI